MIERGDEGPSCPQLSHRFSRLRVPQGKGGVDPGPLKTRTFGEGAAFFYLYGIMLKIFVYFFDSIFDTYVLNMQLLGNEVGTSYG